MSRRRGDQLFKKSEVQRLIDSAKGKGLPIARIDLTPHGRVSLIVGEAAKAKEDNNNKNELDQWLNKHADQTEGH